jgi:hypothetical protein
MFSINLIFMKLIALQIKWIVFDGFPAMQYTCSVQFDQAFD